MSSSASWLAVQTTARGELLEALELAETGRTVNPAEYVPDFACADLANGWFLILVMDHDWMTPERVAELSTFGPAVGCQYDDGVSMDCTTCGAEGGVELWRLTHLGSENRVPVDLEVTGTPPPGHEAVIAEVWEKEKEAERTDEGVDYLLDAPAIVARLRCGFMYLVDDPEMRELKYLGQPAPRPSGGFFSRLFGFGRK